MCRTRLVPVRTALALPVLLLLSAVAAAQDGPQWGLSVSPAQPTTADLVEVTVTEASCPGTFLPTSVEVSDSSVVTMKYASDCEVRFPNAPSFALGPLPAGTYPVRVSFGGETSEIGEITVVEGGAPPELGTGPFILRVPGREQLEVTMADVAGISGCPFRALVTDEVRYDGPVAHVFLREVRFNQSCSGVPQPGEVTTALTPQPEVPFYTAAVWYQAHESAEYRPVASILTPTSPACAGGLGHLCLGDGRFQVRATSTTAAGTGIARPVPLTADSGAFWFFRPDNLELTVKVLDACATFGRYWVFISGMTNQGVDVRVVDTVTRQQRIYRNDLGNGFEAIRDTDAFATCDAAP